LERDALLGDLDLRGPGGGATPALDLVRHPAVSEREDLEATGVRDDRPLPAHEAVQPSPRRDRLLARDEVQVKRVPEHHLVTETGDLTRGQTAHAALRRQRDERRSRNRSVRCTNQARAGCAVTGLDLKTEPVGIRPDPDRVFSLPLLAGA